MTELFEVVGEAEYDEQTDTLLRAGSATCEIADVCPAAVKVKASEIREGDSLFDAFGGTHEVVERRYWPTKRRVYTIREDGFEDVFDADDTVTILRGD